MSGVEKSKERSLVKLPVCTKENFAMWKQRVKFYMMAADPRMFSVIEEGPHVPMTPSTIDPNRLVPKRMMDMNKEEMALVGLDTKAMNIIVGAVEDSMLQNLCNCTSAQQMWKTLITYMEGNDDVRNDRKSLLNQEYEAYRQGKKETISEAYERFFKIVNSLMTYDMKFTNYELNDKFLRSLTKEWDMKVVAIREIGNLVTIEPQKLYGKLLSHELQMNTRKAEEESSTSTTKEKSVALKAEN